MAEVKNITMTRGIYRIETDEGMSLSVKKEHFDKHPLAVGEETDIRVYEKDIALLQVSDCYEAALCVLDRAEKSADGMTEKLKRMGYVTAAVKRSVARLKKCGLIDDERFAGRLAESAKTSGKGLYAAKRMLMQKGISEDDVEAALRDMDSDQQKAAAGKAAREIARKYEKLPPREARQKLIQSLARRGFPWEAASAAADELFPEEW